MINLPILRWGQPYTSMELDEVVHFSTGEPIARVSRATGGMIQRDMRKAQRARDVLREIPMDELMTRVGIAGDLYSNGTLPMGDGSQTPDEFARAQSATTGLPERMCRANMKKNAFVLAEMRSILTSLTRGLDFDVLARGFGEERGVPISYQAQSPVVGLVLPSNSPGVHTLWLPIIPLQIGLVLKPGPQEPWTPYRMVEAFFQAGIPREAISVYPGQGDVGAAVLDSCPRSLIFGGTATVDRYRGNAAVQAHGPGFSKIVIGDDQVDRWETFLDVMVDSVFLNSGRGCINCSGIWASRHTREIANAVAERLAKIRPLPPDDPDASLAAFTVPGVAAAISQAIDADLQTPGVSDITAQHREAARVVKEGTADYLLPTVLHCDSPDAPAAQKEYMFPFVTVVQCPEDQMLKKIGPTLVCTAVTEKPGLRAAFMDATHIDRLNFGPVPTIQLNWRQPHEGNLIDFLFRARAFQTADL
jgi:acyl-CoA reductase-like NAD-dependent aldehyde dehydrogenase